MIRTERNYAYESKEMARFILKGHSEKETAEEFNVSCGTVRNRLKWIGYTYADLLELRESRLANAKQNKRPE